MYAHTYIRSLCYIEVKVLIAPSELLCTWCHYCGAFRPPSDLCGADGRDCNRALLLLETVRKLSFLGMKR